MLDQSASAYEAMAVRRTPAGRYDAAGLALPAVLLIAASALVGLFTLIWRLNATAAGRDAGDTLYYGGLSVMFGYIPYLTGYASFRMAALASSTQLVFRIAAATLALSLAVGVAFAAVGRFPDVIMLVLVFGIPSLAGVVACLAQTAASRVPVPSDD
jgi:hypothetical protein